MNTIIKKILLLVVPILLASACSTPTEKPSADSATADSVVFNLENDSLRCYLNIAVAEPELALPVGEWIDEMLGGYFPGDARQTQALTDFYGNALADTLRQAASESFAGVPMEFEAKVEKVFETDKLVTYTLTNYYGLGGAHPSSGYYGATFRKSDGRRLGWEIVRQYCHYGLTQLFAQQLKDYFGAESDDDLQQYIWEKYAPYDLPDPQTPPIFTAEGIAFVYQQYEIAAYAMGMPDGTIAYDSIRPMLTGWAKQLIEGL